MVIDGLKQMPLTVFKVFRSSRQYKTRCMTANDDRFSIQAQQIVTITGNVEVGQSLWLDPDHRTSAVFSVAVCQRRKWLNADHAEQAQQEYLFSFCHLRKSVLMSYASQRYAINLKPPSFSLKS